LEHNQIIDRAKTSSRVRERDKEFKQAKETQAFNPKFTPTKDDTSPLRSHKGRAITKSLFSSSNPHKGRLVLTKNSPLRRG
jgi:hypothetical protein